MSSNPLHISGEELVRALEGAGYEILLLRGNHVTLKRRSDGRRVTFPVRQGEHVRTATLRDILNDAGLTLEEVRDLL